MPITHAHLLQGEERDSSDEEWAAAYDRMDPISQLGWRNRRSENVGPAAHLVRDIFAAADVVHLDAMSEMAGSGGEVGSHHVQTEATVDSSSSQSTERSMGPGASVEVEQDGEALLPLSHLHFLVWPFELFGL